jgi:MFS family permease
MGALQGLTGLAVASGPLIGGAVAQGLTWQWIFWINVPIGLLAVPLALARIPESTGSDHALDPRGLGLITAAAVGIVWGLVRGNDAGWGSAEVIASLAAGVLLLAAFVAWEARAGAPMLPLRLFRSRAFSAGNGAMFLTFASLFAAVFFVAQFLQSGLGYDPLGAGLRLLPWTGVLFFVAPVAGTLVDRFGERPFLVTGLALQSIGMGWIALIADPGMAYGELIAPLMIAGCGVSMALPAAQNAAVSAVDFEAIGKAAGVNSTLRELGGVFGIAIAVAVFAGAGGYASAQAFSDGFVPAIATSAALSLAGALVALVLPARSRERLAVAPAPVPEGSTS